MKLFDTIIAQSTGGVLPQNNNKTIKERQQSSALELSEKEVCPSAYSFSVLPEGSMRPDASMIPDEDATQTVADEKLNEDGKEDTAMSDEPEVKMTREQLYNEIWEISVAGVARKYDLPYGPLLKFCKGENIPIPPSSYWTKVTFDKPVTKTPLPGLVSELITFPKSNASMLSKKKDAKKVQTVEKDIKSACTDVVVAVDTFQKDEMSLKSGPQNAESISSNPEQDATVVKEHADEAVETYTQWGQSYNIYKREVLYKEVWERPVTEAAKKYGVSDVAIHKVCKSLDIPTPPNGYWAKVYAGKPVTKTPLPHPDKSAQKCGIRTGIENTTECDSKMLGFLDEEDRMIILAISDQIQLPDEGAKMHPKIIAHRSVIAQWRKKDTGEYHGPRYNRESPPFLADTISEETLPRVFHIIDGLIHAMEPVGCSLTDDLKFVVRGETVSIQITEAQDQVNHVNTKEENLQLLRYEDEKKRYSYASKPNIRKYDYIFNGHISITVQSSKKFRDCKSYLLEDKLGDILIQIYEASDVLRKEREAREEADRKRKEEERMREERRKRYNAEVDQTLALKNSAEDYDTACKIRRYIAAIETSEKSDEETLAWIEWAKAKADWYDPTVDKKDEIFGKREHENGEEQKALKHAGYSW